MRVWLNDNPITCEPNTSLSQLLDAHGFSRSGMAIAVNQTIIPAPHWASHTLQDNDRVLVFQAIAGG